MKKRRFYEGGFSDIDEGRDTPDQALARKASDSKYASDAADKATGLAASKGEDVGFWKRLSMGNIDKADSEAGQQFGAGRARLDRMPAAPDRRKAMGNMEGLETPPTPRPPINLPPTPVATKPDKFSDFGDNADTGTIDYSPVNKPSVKPVVKPTVKPTISSSDDAMKMGRGRPATDDSMKMGRGRPATGAPMVNSPEADYKRISQPGRDAIENVYPEEYLIPGAKIAKAGLNALKGGAKAAEAAGSTSRALADSTTPVTFLGKSAPKNITPMERIGGEQAKRLAYTEGEGAASAAAPRVGGPAATAEKAAETVARLKGPKTGGSSGPTERNPFSAAKEKSPRGRSSFKTAEDLEPEFKRGGKTKAYAKGGSVSASRGDGIAQRGKTRGMMR